MNNYESPIINYEDLNVGNMGIQRENNKDNYNLYDLINKAGWYFSSHLGLIFLKQLRKEGIFKLQNYYEKSTALIGISAIPIFYLSAYKFLVKYSDPNFALQAILIGIILTNITAVGVYIFNNKNLESRIKGEV